MSQRSPRRGIPDVAGLPTHVRAVLEPMKEIIERREGIRGEQLDRFVSYRDLVELGLSDGAETNAVDDASRIIATQVFGP